MKNILITGGAGFIGSNFIRLLLQEYPRSELKIHNLDALTYAGHRESIQDLDGLPNYCFHHQNICDKPGLEKLFIQHQIDTVVHFAAESHVDRSIQDPSPFILTNVLGTQNLLEVSRQTNVTKFIHVSTDEVYGALGATGYFSESTPLAPNSPYSASKASSDLLVRAYFQTYGFPAMITRCSNNYGPYQLPEKMIPKMIALATADLPLPVYGQGLQIRDWLYVEDHCRGILAVLKKGRSGEVYNIGGGTELSNIILVKHLLKILGKPESLITFVPDRLGHDFRYAIDHEKITQELGWTPRVSFESGLEKTIDWYMRNQDWIKIVQ